MKISRGLFLIWMIIGLTGCGRMVASMHNIPYDVQNQRQAQNLLQVVVEKNPVPETFKGIGNISIIKDHMLEKGRIAWMASGSDKLRIELLSPYGQPVVSFASDGQHVYLVDHFEKQFYKRTLSESGLKHFISISVHPEEIISLFSGSPPQMEYSYIFLERSENDSGNVLVLQKKWWKGYQKIYLNKEGNHIYAIEVYDGSGELKYRADFSKITAINGGYRIPYRLEISDGQGAMIELMVSRFWVNVEISNDSFMLAPPEG